MNKKVGYRMPPSSTRFRKPNSGNPAGRPKGRRCQLPHETVLGQLVTIHENGIERRVTAEEAFLRFMKKRALEGDAFAGRLILAFYEKARALEPIDKEGAISEVRMIVFDPGSVSHLVELLRMGAKADRFRESAQMKIEPWLVEAALARFGNRRLTGDEQKMVYQCTRTPWKVKWPEWWKFHGQSE